MQTYDDIDFKLITARGLNVSCGAELLDANDNVIGDLTPDLDQTSGSVDRSNYADIHGTCRFDIRRELDWENARVRLFQKLSTPSIPARRYDLGVYLLTQPDDEVGDTPPAWSVSGEDKLVLLDHEVGDSYYLPAGTNVLDAGMQVFEDSGYTGLEPFIDSTAQAKVLPEDLVWLGTVEEIRWIDILNDLYKAIGYQKLWADQVGRFRSAPLLPASARAPEWKFDLVNQKIDIVDQPRSRTQNLRKRTNHWRFVRAGVTLPPAEGSGVYTVNLTGGAVKRPKVRTLTAVDQAALVAQGDMVVAEDTQLTKVLSIATGPMPILGNLDVMDFYDPYGLGEFKVQAQSYSIPLNGDRVKHRLEVV